MVLKFLELDQYTERFIYLCWYLEVTEKGQFVMGSAVSMKERGATWLGPPISNQRIPYDQRATNNVHAWN